MMFDELFKVFDIPLICVVIWLTFISTLFAGNIYNIFLNLFINLFLVIFISATVLTQQINLGEFLVISSFFILTIVFFMFSLNYNYDDPVFEDDTKPVLGYIKNAFMIMAFVCGFFIFGLNFSKIDFNSETLPTKNVTISDTVSITDMKNEDEYNEYVENISLLNQNRLFQRLTHIIMFYICMVMILFFFNKKEENNEG